MSDIFFFRDALEPEGTDPLQSRAGAGAGETTGDEFVDYKVHATDGNVGMVLDVQRGPGESYLIVQTGATILSKKVLLPAGLVERVDRDNRTLYVDRSRDEIKHAPEFDEARYRDEAYRAQVGEYYSR